MLRANGAGWFACRQNVELVGQEGIAHTILNRSACSGGITAEYAEYAESGINHKKRIDRRGAGLSFVFLVLFVVDS